MAHLLERLIRHAFSTHRTTRRAYPAPMLARLHQAITQGEAHHSGEVHLIVEGSMPLRQILHNSSSRQRALDLFGTFRIWDTEFNNGVLLYINLADRKVELIADRAASRSVPQERWQAICSGLREALRRAQYEAGTMEAIRLIQSELHAVFPAEHRIENALSDAPTVL